MIEAKKKKLKGMGEFSSLTHVSPGLTQQKLDEALTEWFKEDVHFTYWQYVGDTGKGDAYLSELIRIKIFGENNDEEERHVQVILKSIPKNTSRRLTFRSDDFFRNEINFYTKVLPELLNFQSKKKLKDPFNSHVQLFLTYSDGIHDCICLEDASLFGFGSAIRQEGIDVEHCKKTLETLAKFHAISFAFKDQEPKQFEETRQWIREEYYDERLKPWYFRFWARICGIAINAVEQEYPGTNYVQKIKEFAVPKRYDNMIEAATNTLATGVFSHGDCWTNNFLYKYENGIPIDAKIIDFQLARCASPVLDLSFFIYACTSQELRVNHYQELLKHYHDILKRQIRDLGSDPDKLYSWDMFLDEIKRYSFFGLAFSFESTPFIVLAPEDSVPMDMEGEEKLNIEDFWQIGNFKTKEGRLREANNIVHCVDNGYI